MKLYKILGTSGPYRWCPQPRANFASCSRASFCLQGMYLVSGSCIGKLGTSMCAVYTQHKREMRHGKLFLGVIGF